MGEDIALVIAGSSMVVSVLALLIVRVRSRAFDRKYGAGPAEVRNPAVPPHIS